MDDIFRESSSIFDVVKVARDTPKRYGKHGELLINYLDTEDSAGRNEARRRSSIATSAAGGATAKVGAERREMLQQEKLGASHDEGSSSNSIDREKR